GGVVIGENLHVVPPWKVGVEIHHLLAGQVERQDSGHLEEIEYRRRRVSGSSGRLEKRARRRGTAIGGVAEVNEEHIGVDADHARRLVAFRALSAVLYAGRVPRKVASISGQASLYGRTASPPVSSKGTSRATGFPRKVTAICSPV